MHTSWAFVNKCCCLVEVSSLGYEMANKPTSALVQNYEIQEKFASVLLHTERCHVIVCKTL